MFKSGFSLQTATQDIISVNVIDLYTHYLREVGRCLIMNSVYANSPPPLLSTLTH